LDVVPQEILPSTTLLLGGVAWASVRECHLSTLVSVALYDTD
jgi:hypothetical protein